MSSLQVPPTVSIKKTVARWCFLIQKSVSYFFLMKIKILLTPLSFLWCRQRPRRSSWWRLADLQSRERGCRLLHVCGSESSWYSLGQNQVKCSRYPNHKSVCLHCTAAVTMNTKIHMSKIVVNSLSLCHLWPLWRKKLYVLGRFFWHCLCKKTKASHHILIFCKRLFGTLFHWRWFLKPFSP